MGTYNDFTSFLSISDRYLTIPIFQSFFMDTVTPIKAFHSLKEEATFLLESKDSTSPWSRYSFIGLNPFLSIEGRECIQLLDNKRNTIYQSNEIQGVFDFACRTILAAPLELDIPFKGGAVGYISYDFIHLLEKIPTHRHSQQEQLVNLQFCETIVILDHQTKNVSVIHYLKLDGTETIEEKKVIFDQGLETIKAYMKKLKNHMKEDVISINSKNAGMEELEFRSSYTKEKFIEDVEIIKDYIRKGDIFQCVLSQRFSVELEIEGLDVYRVLRNINPSPYLFYLKFSDRELIGSSPERLIEVKGKNLEIHPIAGTRRRGRTEREDQDLGKELMNDEKEQAEHVMLVDLARNDIGRVAEYGTVHTSTFKELVYFSRVMHLISVVRGELHSKYTPLDALLAAFPAGTVSGAPKVRAMQIIQELEPIERNTYAGAVCYIGFDGNIDSCITIRTIEKKGTTFHVQAGAGVVADSIPHLEWEETINKAKALLETLRYANYLFQKREGDLFV